MTEEIKPTAETAETPVQSASVPVTNQTPPASADAEVFDEKRAMDTIRKLREIEKQSKQDAKELARLREAEAKRQESEMTELQRVQKQAADLQAERDKLALDLIRRDVISETGLPPLLADRLKGDTKEAMLADAQEILKVLPQQITQPKAPHVNPTNPGNGQTVETEAQKRERLFGSNSNIFDLRTIEARGGGVRWTKPPGE